MDDAWVNSQRKTMTRWINSVIQGESVAPITNLEQDLSDGLVLYALVNNMLKTSNSDYSGTTLTPLYKAPKFKLQKVENVADVLEFLRVALQVNVCNISAENIVDKNSKLVLGFVWSLYMYSSTSTLSKAHEDCNTFHKIKKILLDWVNSIIIKKDLRISNFDRDWSIQENRPDLILWAILDHYNPENKPYRSEKKIQNLQAALDRANELGINLSDIDDYLVLVCDEQCIVTTMLEWFKYFEIDKAAPTRVLDKFIEQIVDAVALKRQYESDLKLYFGKIERISAGMKSNLDVIESDSLTDTCELLHRCCTFFDIIVMAESDEDLVHTMDALQCILQMVESSYTSLLDAFEDFETYGKSMKPQIVDEEYEKLTSRLQLLQEKLQQLGTYYEPSDVSNPLKLLVKLSEVADMETKFVEKSEVVVKGLLQVKFPNQRADQEGCSEWRRNTIKSCLAKFQSFDKIRNNLQDFLGRFDKTFPLEKIRRGFAMPKPDAEVCDDIDYFELQMETSVTTEVKLFDAILNKVSEDISVDLITSFLNLIPLETKKFERSESDFTLNYPLDESDDSNSVFDEVQRSLGSQLAGPQRVYDIKQFLYRIRNGFQV